MLRFSSQICMSTGSSCVGFLFSLRFLSTWCIYTSRFLICYFFCCDFFIMLRFWSKNYMSTGSLCLGLFSLQFLSTFYSDSLTWNKTLCLHFFLLSKTRMIIHLCCSSGSLGVSWHPLCCLQSVLPLYVVWIYIYLVYIYICFYVLGLYIHLVINAYFICVFSLQHRLRLFVIPHYVLQTVYVQSLR